MMATDEDALICDFAETYHVYDYRQLKPSYAATLAAGLREGSRIRTVLGGIPTPLPLYLQMAELDALNLIAWLNSSDGADGKNRPKSLLKAFTDDDNAVQGFDSGEDFMTEWKRRTEGHNA
jgi:hypothetical protein